MSVLGDIQAVLAEAASLRELIQNIHNEALSDPQLILDARPKIKSFLEHERSALDYLAVDLVNRFGKPGGNVYYPMAKTEAKFVSTVDGRTPGIAAARPDIVTVIRAHQPWKYVGHPLQYLVDLSNPNKHTRLSSHLVREIHEVRIVEKASGYNVVVTGIDITPGLMTVAAAGGTISLEPGFEAPEHEPFHVGGLFGATVFGVPFDGNGRPLPSPTIQVSETTRTDWCFFQPHAPVMIVLDSIHQEVVATISDIVLISQ